MAVLDMPTVWTRIQTSRKSVLGRRAKGDTVKPIRPSEVQNRKNETIPDVVIEAFNELIVKGLNASGTHSTVKQSEAVALIHSKDSTLSGTLVDNGWLDVEDLYRCAGWEVEYDKPGYNESYPATFKFSKKR